jgi:hypothetical protein
VTVLSASKVRMGGDSLFFEYACKLKLQQGDDILLCMDWDSSASKSPSLVVGSSDERCVFAMFALRSCLYRDG